MSAQSLYALLPVSIIVLSLALVAVVASYAPVLKWFFAYKQDEKNYRASSLKESQAILDGARKQAEEIILAAGKKAEENINNLTVLDQNAITQSQEFLREFTVKRNQELDQITQQYINEYKILFDTIKNEDLAKLKFTSESITEQFNNLLGSLETTVKQETQEYIKIIQKRLDQSNEIIQNDLNAYKQHQLEILSDHVYQIVCQVIAGNIAKTLSPDEHKALIMKSLAQIKSNNDQNHPS